MTKLFTLFALLSVLACSFGQTTPDPNMTITSQGTGKADVPLTTARITVRVEQTSMMATDAQANVSATANSIITFLLNSGVNQTDIRTTSISVQPEYNYVNGTQILLGYKATYIFTFDVPVGNAGSYLDRIVSMNGFVDSITFLGSPEDIDQAQNEALTLATQDAKNKATTVLSALGLCPDGVKSATVGYVQAPQSSTTSDKIMFAAATPVLPGTGSVTANVDVEWMFMECASNVNGTTNNLGETGTQQ